MSTVIFTAQSLHTTGLYGAAAPDWYDSANTVVFLVHFPPFYNIDSQVHVVLFRH